MASSDKLPIDPQLDAASKSELDEFGYTIIEDLLTPLQVQTALAAVQRLFDWQLHQSC